MPQLAHKEDCYVEHSVTFGAPVVELRDEEGDLLHTFPDGTTDEQVMSALAFANKAYNLGFEAGADDQARQTRAILRIK